MRSALLFVALASVLACGAWRAHAGAAAGAGAAPTASRKMDEYGNIRWGDEKRRLDHFAGEARNDPTARACLVCYGGRRSRAGEARSRCVRAADYLRRVGGLDAARIVTMNGGFREELTVELWLPSFGTSLPAVSPTLDPSEVTIIKDTSGRKRPPRAKR